LLHQGVTIGGVLAKNKVFGFVFIVKLLWELNAKQGMNTLELEWKQKKTIKTLRMALL
jgi:hypothetical protein